MTEADAISTTSPTAPSPAAGGNGPPKLSAKAALAFLGPLIEDFEGGICALSAVLGEVMPLLEANHADTAAALRFMVRQLNVVVQDMDEAVRAAEGAA